MNYRVRNTTETDGERRTTHHLPTEVFAGVADARRRIVLDVLTDQPTLHEQALATRVAARERATRVGDVTASERQRVWISLHHRHLPKLADLGFVTRVDDEVRLAADAPDVEELGLLDVPDGTCGGPADRADALFDALANDQRRTILAILESRTAGAESDALSAAELADAVVATEFDGDADVTADPSRATVTLLHRDLPKLADVGLVSHDREVDRVAFEGHPFLRTEWFAHGTSQRSER